MRINVNKMVGITPDGTFLVVDSLFDHGDGFKGATGSEYRPLNENDYERETSTDALADLYESLWREDAGSVNGTTDGLEDWIDERHHELVEGMFDVDDSPLPTEHDGIGIVAWENISCGRIFNGTDLFNVTDNALWDKVCEYES